MSRIRIPKSWSPEDALTVAYFLEDVATAIWKEHGNAMTELIHDLDDDRGALPRAQVDPDDEADPDWEIPF
jgi:hypothetical protein